MIRLRSDFEYVASSRWLTDEPSSYLSGVYNRGLVPPFAAIPREPDQTNVDVSALPSSIDGVGKSESLRPSGSCA